MGFPRPPSSEREKHAAVATTLPQFSVVSLGQTSRSSIDALQKPPRSSEVVPHRGLEVGEKSVSCVEPDALCNSDFHECTRLYLIRHLGLQFVVFSIQLKYLV